MELSAKEKYDFVRTTAGYRLNKHKIDLFFKDVDLSSISSEKELKGILERWLMKRFRTAKKFVKNILLVREGNNNDFLCLDSRGKTYIVKDHNELMQLDLRDARYENSTVS